MEGKEKDPEGKWVLAYVCSFCGTPHETKEQASQCWDSHSELTIDYVWGGIGTGHDMPVECIIKKYERGYITEIATYKLEEIKKVKMRVRKVDKIEEK